MIFVCLPEATPLFIMFQCAWGSAADSSAVSSLRTRPPHRPPCPLLGRSAWNVESKHQKMGVFTHQQWKIIEKPGENRNIIGKWRFTLWSPLTVCYGFNFTICTGKTHDFNWAIFHSELLNFQRGIQNMAQWHLKSGSKEIGPMWTESIMAPMARGPCSCPLCQGDSLSHVCWSRRNPYNGWNRTHLWWWLGDGLWHWVILGLHPLQESKCTVRPWYIWKESLPENASASPLFYEIPCNA